MILSKKTFKCIMFNPINHSMFLLCIFIFILCFKYVQHRFVASQCATRLQSRLMYQPLIHSDAHGQTRIIGMTATTSTKIH